MRRLKVSRQARQDLKEIVRFVAQDKPAAAHRLRESLEVAFRLLAREPMTGEACRDLGTDVRMFSVANYVIFFRSSETGVVIARVIHGRRDASTLWPLE
jgi:toxin ParE1/3/4